MSEIKAALSRHRFFKGIDAGFLQILHDCAFRVDFEATAFMSRRGEPADRFYLILAGKVALEIFSAGHGARIVETLTAGDILGASWLFPPYRFQWDGRCLEPTKAVAFNAKCLRDICEADHDLGYELMKRFAVVMVQRLQASRIQGLDVYAKPNRSAR